MANGKNVVMLRGHLGAEPEMRYTPNQTAIASLRLATSETYKDRDGKRQTKTEWHRVTVFRQPAEFLAAYAKKGSHVEITGSLQTRKWQDQSGNDRYSTEVVVSGPRHSVELLDPRDENRETPGHDRTTGTTDGPKKAGGDSPPPDFDDDIPF